MLTPEDHQLLEKCVLCWLATANQEGQPNVSPKEIFKAHGDRHLLIANIASPNSKRNIARNTSVAVSCLDIFTQKGIQLKGTAEIVHKEDVRFSALAIPLLEMTQGLFPFNSLFLIEITNKKPILAPRYLLFPGTTEAEQIASAMQAYGVRPAGD